MMNIEKVNEQFRVTDTYTYEGVEYVVTGNFTKSKVEATISLNVEEIGYVTYLDSMNPNYNFSINKDTPVPANEFMNAMYDKIISLLEFNTEE